jgi:hypothetical protein
MNISFYLKLGHKQQSKQYALYLYLKIKLYPKNLPLKSISKYYPQSIPQTLSKL